MTPVLFFTFDLLPQAKMTWTAVDAVFLLFTKVKVTIPLCKNTQLQGKVLKMLLKAAIIDISIQRE